MCYEELYQENRPEHFEAELAAEFEQNNARTPVWCKVLTLKDLCVGAGLFRTHETPNGFFAIQRAITNRYSTGWVTAAWIKDALSDEFRYRSDHPEYFEAIEKVATELPADVLVLIDEYDQETGVGFRDHYQPMQSKRSRPRPPKAETLLRTFLAKNADQQIRGVHEVILPKDDGLWVAVVFGPTEEEYNDAFMIRAGVFQAVGSDNKPFDKAHRGSAQVYIWRFSSMKDQQKFIERTRRAITQLIEFERLRSEEYLASLAADTPSI
ncbi:MAG: hypothetical protein HEQ38_05705 [Gemmatimonas sp.]|nr:hypothetical protein [Gemmatimonas sp.]